MRSHIKTSRHIDTTVHVVHSFRSIDLFCEQSRLDAGINSVWRGGLPIDFLVTPRKTETLIVVLNGAITPEVRLPWLTGWGVTNGTNASTMFVSDPSLYLGEGLTSAYYSGNLHQPALQQDLVRIVEKVATSLGASRVVFLGGSSGGFAALGLSRNFPKSTAVVFNPQTNLWLHLPRPVHKWLTVAWDVKRLEDLPSSVNCDITAQYSETFENRVIYMQNRTDHHHDRHLLPFLAKAGRGDLQYMVHDEAQGHKPPPKELIRRVLEEASVTEAGDILDGFSRR